MGYGHRPERRLTGGRRTSGNGVHQALTKIQYFASFLGRVPGQALFVGLYRVNTWKEMATTDILKLAAVAELVERGNEPDTTRPTYVWFDLVPVPDFYPERKGRLVINWPPPERSWWRRAHNKDEMTVLTIHEDSALEAEMDPWESLVLSWDDLGVMPARWKAAIKEWRGAYYTFDVSDGMGYVGSASGGDNLLGRWLGYAATGHGGNVLLRDRDPKDFRFSILQRVSPDMPPAEVVALESTWKRRLHSRTPFGLNDN